MEPFAAVCKCHVVTTPPDGWDVDQVGRYSPR